MADASTSPQRRPVASNTDSQSSSAQKWRGSNQSSILPTYQQNVHLNKQIKSIQIEKSALEQELVTAKVQWATQELECDKLRHSLQIHQEREEKLAAEKFEETLKLSILEKQH